MAQYLLLILQNACSSFVEFIRHFRCLSNTWSSMVIKTQLYHSTRNFIKFLIENRYVLSSIRIQTLISWLTDQPPRKQWAQRTWPSTLPKDTTWVKFSNFSFMSNCCFVLSNFVKVKIIVIDFFLFVKMTFSCFWQDKYLSIFHFAEKLPPPI